MSKWTFDRIPDLSNKVFIVTGASAGLGRVTTRELAKKGAHVIMACRSEDKTKPILDALKQETSNQNIEFMALDLGDLESVDKFADAFLARPNPKLHGLILNAGVMATPFSLTKDGIEMQFGTNHVGHFHLTQRLLGVVEASAPSRIVCLTSSAHRMAPSPEGIRFDMINDEKSYGSWTAYGQSKLANMLFAKELAARLEQRGVKNVWVNCVHPGVIKTELARHVKSTFMGRIALSVLTAILSVVGLQISEDEGSSTSLYLATDPEIEEKNYKGEYFEPIAKLSKPAIPQGSDMELAKKLFEFTEKLVAEKLALRK